MHKIAFNNGVLTYGHGPEHDLTVAKFCLMLTDDQDTRELAWIAALLHSIDRLNQPLQSTVKLMLSYLPNDYFTEREKEAIADAVFHHAEKNKSEDSEVLIVLKDADRLANLSPEIIMRAGQFAPAVPSFNLKSLGGPHPSGSFGNPKTALDDLYYALEWIMGEKFWLQPRLQWLEYSQKNHWFRTTRAWPVAWRYAQILLKYIEGLKSEHTWLADVI